jgi:hypothetical protein
METLAERVTREVFGKIMIAANNTAQKEPITAGDISTTIRKLKNKASLDYNNISNRILKNTGKDFITSLEILFQEIDNTNTSPEAWEEMIIKSIYKGKNSKKEMDNRRGLFITSVVSKLFEKTKLNTQRNTIENKLSKFQTGGVQGKSPIDNKMVLNATIDYNNLIKRETYVLFADAYKCFDKIDLKTSLIDLYEILGPQEAKLLYNMNKRAKITIKTPVGETKPISVEEITKQGTLYGPILCNINTDKVNKIGTKNISTIGPEIECESSIYVDDIEHAGSHINIIERAAQNCGSMEDLRKFTFNNKVEKTAFMIVNPKKKSQDIQELRTTVKRGKIGRTKEYQWLGEWYTENAKHEKSIQERKNKSIGIIAKIKFYGDVYKVGNMAHQVRIEIFQSTVVQTIYHDVEAWSKISKKEVEKLDKIQKDVLTSILELPTSTPYMGLLSELGIWPFEQRLEYKRIMLLHQIITSKESRFLKQVIEQQIKDTWQGCWMEQTTMICQKYDIRTETIRELTKDKLKEIMKTRINTYLEQSIQDQSKEKTKLRFCSDFKRKLYTMRGSLKFDNVKCIMKLRLNMLELKTNYKGVNKNETCDLCKMENDTTEHLFECKKVKESIKNVPKIEILKKDEENSYCELSTFLEEVCKLKQIDVSKTVKENLEEKQTLDTYTIKSVSKNGLKIVLTKT